MKLPPPENYLPRCSPKYYGIYPPVLFMCADGTYYMHFILSLKCIHGSDLEHLVELFTHCGAHLSFEIEDASDHSVIIVDHNDVVDYKAPAFKIDYLMECIQHKKLKQISGVQFRQDATSHIARDVDCMEVVYFRTTGWTSVLTKAEKDWFDQNANASNIEDFEPLAASSQLNVLSLVNERDGYQSDLESESEREYESETSHEPKDESTLEEDSRKSPNKVRQFENDQEERDLDMEVRQMIQHGTLKDTMNIVNRIASEAQHAQSKNSRRSTRNETKPSSSAPSSKKWAFLDEFHPSDGSDADSSNSVGVKEATEQAMKDQVLSSDSSDFSNDDESLNPTTVANKKEAMKDQVLSPDSSDSYESNEESLNPTTVENKKNGDPENTTSRGFAGDSKCKTTKDPKHGDPEKSTRTKTKDPKHSRMPYSHTERSQILKYIVENSEYSRLKGRELWMNMERRKICQNRTWQSMKEHFLKKIVCNLESYDFLTDQEKKKLKPMFAEVNKLGKTDDCV